MPHMKQAKINAQTNTEDDDDQPRMMISVKMLAGYLPTINLKPNATVADLADAVISSNPDAYYNCRPVFIRAQADDESEELEDESRLLSSFGLQCGDAGEVEELVLLIEKISELVDQLQCLYRQKVKKDPNCITDTVTRLLQRGGRYTTELDLGFTDLGDALCYAMVPAMVSLTSITNLDLGYSAIGDAGIQIMASGLINMKSLTHLDLSNNKFSDDGFCDVACALMELKALTYLDLSNNKIEEMGGLALAAALDSLQALKYMGLSKNKVGDVGVSALTSAMMSLVNLTSLDLLGTGFDKNACAALTSVLPALVALQYT